MALHQGYRRIVEPLLKALTPLDGACVLLLRHPIGNVYFPLAVTTGRKTNHYPEDVMEWYYLYATRLEFHDGRSTHTFDDRSAVDRLVLSGKLAIALFDGGPVRQEAFACDDNVDVVLASLSPSGSSVRGSIEPLEDIRKTLAATVDVWQGERRAAPQIDANSPIELIDILNSLAADHSSDPPYVPILHSRVGWRAGPSSEYRYTTWATNALSYNTTALT